ncbi:hypothetical protein Tco_0640492 [Tanacetum coccineum]
MIAFIVFNILRKKGNADEVKEKQDMCSTLQKWVIELEIKLKERTHMFRKPLKIWDPRDKIFQDNTLRTRWFFEGVGSDTLVVDTCHTPPRRKHEA